MFFGFPSGSKIKEPSRIPGVNHYRAVDVLLDGRLSTIHNTPHKGVHLDFSLPARFTMEEIPSSLLHQRMIKQRLDSQLGRPYAWFFNCEDLVTFAYTGTPYSKQREAAQSALLLLSFAGLLFLLTTSEQ